MQPDVHPEQLVDEGLAEQPLPDPLAELPEGWTTRVTSDGRYQFVPPGATLSDETAP